MWRDSVFVSDGKGGWWHIVGVVGLSSGDGKGFEEDINIGWPSPNGLARRTLMQLVD